MSGIISSVASSIGNTTVEELVYYGASIYGGAALVGAAAGCAVFGGYGAYAACESSLGALAGRFSASPDNTKIPAFTVSFSNNCRKLQREKKLYPFAYNRKNLINQIENRLGTKDNSMVFLHGPPGSGKTAIVEEIVRRQITKESDVFEGYEFIKLNQNELYNLQEGVWKKIKDTLFFNGSVAHLDKLFKEIANKKYILFIDEAQTVLRSQFFNNKLEELARGEVKIILATTTEDMEKIATSWSEAMNRRIPKIEVRELTMKETAKALKEGLKDYNERYEVEIEEEIIPTIVALSAFHEEHQKISKTYFPHKSVHFLGEICTEFKRGKITREGVLEYYSRVYNIDKSILSRRIKTIIQEDILADETLFNNLIEFLESQSIGSQEVNVEQEADSEFVSACNRSKDFIINSSASMSLLIGSSHYVQQAVIENIASSVSVAQLSIRQLITTFNSLKSEEQKRQFRKAFYSFIEKISDPDNSHYLHIKDGELLWQLISERSSSSDNLESPVEQGAFADFQLPSIPLVQDILQGVESIGNQFGVSIPEGISLPTKIKRKGESLTQNEIAQEFVRLFDEKKVKMIASVNRAVIQKDFNVKGSDNLQACFLPDLDFVEGIQFLQASFEAIPEDFIWKVLLSVMYFVEDPENPYFLPLDIAYQLLTAITKNTEDGNDIAEEFIQCLQSYNFFAKKGHIEKEEFERVWNIFRKFNLDEWKNGGHWEEPIEVGIEQAEALEARNLMQHISENKKKLSYIFEPNKEKRKLFIEGIVQTVRNGIEGIKTQHTYQITGKSLLTPKLPEAFQRKIIYWRLQQLRKNLLAKNEKHSVLLVEASSSLITPEISALFNLLSIENKVKVIYISPSNEKASPGIAQTAFKIDTIKDSVLMKNMPLVPKLVINSGLDSLQGYIGEEVRLPTWSVTEQNVDIRTELVPRNNVKKSGLISRIFSSFKKRVVKPVVGVVTYPFKAVRLRFRGKAEGSMENTEA